MRFLLFIIMWAFALSPHLQAQSINDIKMEMEQYVQEHMDTPVPNEKAIALSALESEIREGVKESQEGLSNESGVDESRLMEIIKGVRKAFWEKTFCQDNRDRILEARRINRENPDPMRTGGTPLANPNLPAICPLNVAIIIDQSFSIDLIESQQIRDGFITFLDHVVDSDNTITFIGMGSQSAGAPPNISSTVTYSTGQTPNAQIDWVNNVNDNGLFMFAGTGVSGASNWGSALAAANGLSPIPDLVLIVSDGAVKNPADYALACQSADALKQSGANDGNGTHIFAIASNDNEDYHDGTSSVTLVPFIDGIIDPLPVEAANVSLVELSTHDYIGFVDGNFTQVEAWLGTILVDCCNLVVDCSKLRGQRVLCHEDVPSGDITLPIIVESCGPVTVSYVDYWTGPLGPGSVLRIYTITDLAGNTATCSQKFDINGVGFIDLIGIGDIEGSCLESKVCFSGEYELCDGISELPPTLLVFKENNLTLATFPITLNPNGTFSKCLTKEELLEAGLEAGTGYDVCVLLDTDFGTTLVSRPFITGLNNDFRIDVYQGEIVSVPDCVEEGVPFEVVVMVNGWINSEDFENIYSANNLYTYVSHSIKWTLGFQTQLTITFVSNTCNCHGEMLTFDIVMAGCSTPIWLMTDPIPCCAGDCKDISIANWSAGDCFYYNDDLARPFSIEINSASPIIGIFSVENTATCQTSLADVSIDPGSTSGTYTITGNMVFDDSNCVGHAWLSFVLETQNGCCRIDQQFSFPKDCTIAKSCDVGPADVELIYDGNPPTMTVSINLPLGTVVTVTNNTTGEVFTPIVEDILCGPFWVDENDVIQGGSDCNGILFNTPGGYDCQEPIDGQNTAYHFTITYGQCIWIIAGDYCQEATIYRNIVGPISSNGKLISKSGDRSASISPSFREDNIVVYPNPIQSSEVLTFDFTQSKVAVKTIRITDMNGRLIENVIPQEGTKVFSHQMSQDMVKGVYFVVFGLEDGSAESKKLISIE